MWNNTCLHPGKFLRIKPWQLVGISTICWVTLYPRVLGGIPQRILFAMGYLFYFYFFGAAGFGIIFGFLVLCFPASLLFCFLLFLLLCFSALPASSLFCFSAFPASLLFCFCALPASFLFCFSAFLLLCLCTFLLLLLYFFLQACIFPFCCSTSCFFASLLSVFTASLFFFFSFALLSPVCKHPR